MEIPAKYNPFRSFRAAARFKDIVTVLVRYGFDDIAERMGLSAGGKLLRKITKVEDDLNLYQRIRHAAEDLGPTYVKIAQILSLRPDLIPAALVRELKNLQEDVRPEGFSDIKSVIEECLGRPLEELYESFNPEPMAAASLSQVHEAKLKGTREQVAVKVQRPGVRRIIDSDLDLLAYLAGLAHREIDFLKQYNLPEVVAEVRKTMRRELDFEHEADNIDVFNLNFADEPGVFAPAAYRSHTCRKVLTMDLVQGAHVAELDMDLSRRTRLAEMGMSAAMKQVLEDGLFHADPHPGNLRVVERDGGDALVFYDWGMVGRLTEDMQSVLIDFLMAVVQQDSAKLMHAVMDMSRDILPEFDELTFQTEALYMLDKLHSSSMRNDSVTDQLMEMIEAGRHLGLKLRTNYVYMLRTLMASEATARHLQPDFDFVAHLKPITVKHMIRRYTLLFSDKSPLDELFRTLESAAAIPGQLSKVLKRMETGTAVLEIRHTRLDSLLQTTTTVGNRIASSLIIAALVVGSSMLMSAKVGPMWHGYPALGLVGYVISGLFGLWLIFSMIFKK